MDTVHTLFKDRYNYSTHTFALVQAKVTTETRSQSFSYQLDKTSIANRFDYKTFNEKIQKQLLITNQELLNQSNIAHQCIWGPITLAGRIGICRHSP